MLRRLATLASLVLLAVLLPSAALADDEGSEHTAQLVGDASDTLGVTVAFDAKLGWSMAVRPQPGAEVRSSQLAALPRHHAHYLVYVAPGRKAIAFVEQSAGVTTERKAIAASDPVAWVFAADGKLLRSWTYGQVLTPAELAKAPRSISHQWWIASHTLGKAGLEIVVAHRGAKLLLDARATRLAR